MAKCKICKVNIPEGSEYCEDCQAKGITLGNESYLDSLLSSVKNSSPSVDSIYKKKGNRSEKKSNSEISIVSEEELNTQEEYHNEKDAQDLEEADFMWDTDPDFDDTYKLDIKDIEDFEKYNLEDDLSDIDNEFTVSDEDLFGENLDKFIDNDSNQSSNHSHTDLQNVRKQMESRSEQFPDIDDTYAAALEVPEQLIDEIPQEEEDVKELTDTTDAEAENLLQNEEQSDFTEQQVINHIGSSDSEEFDPSLLGLVLDQPEVEGSDPEEAFDNIASDELSSINEEESMDLDLDELLNGLDTSNHENTSEYPTEVKSENTENDFDLSDISLEDKKAGEFEEVEAESDDFLNLLNQMSTEDPVAADVKAINDMLKSNKTSSTNSMPSDVGEVFSDALKAVSSLEDYEEEEDILNRISNKQDLNVKKKKAVKKEKKAKSKKPKKEKSKVGLWKRLFGNVKDEKTAAEHAAEIKAMQEPVAEKPKKEKKKGKGNKGATGTGEEEGVTDNKKAAKDKKAAKLAAKKEKAEKKKQAKDAIKVIDEIDEDPGRINRLGAIIVFVFFAALASVLVLGSKVVSYSLSIQHATSYFDNRKYTQAYNEVYGVDIKDEDIVIYDKIMTVMYVNKQLNSYNNYYSMEKYPEALDSLLKGLSRYDKYIELATMLGIESDMDYVRSQILAELNNVYHISEKDAMEIINSKTMEAYSTAVYDVVLENMNN